MSDFNFRTSAGPEVDRIMSGFFRAWQDRFVCGAHELHWGLEELRAELRRIQEAEAGGSTP